MKPQPTNRSQFYGLFRAKHARSCPLRHLRGVNSKGLTSVFGQLRIAVLPTVVREVKRDFRGAARVPSSWTIEIMKRREEKRVEEPRSRENERRTRRVRNARESLEPLSTTNEPRLYRARHSRAARGPYLPPGLNIR
ncbi:hypothetical protein X777_16978 [Ooceraea biroi]|uniref:Uncharacterized protein n=1 Tax=Ooceraea biroi TaxID=2015173 RepID=A0A026WSQ5_OOCBI|nr:hypothetical protein X777_16978 [Ooceraea biroi]